MEMMGIRCAAAENDDKNWPGADDLKQQGWLSKIVPPPKEATALVCAADPGGVLVVAEQTLLMR
jgi:hypothetical protein